MTDEGLQGRGIVVRAAVASDAPRRVEGNASMALETEKKTLDKDKLVPGVDAVLADPSKGFYLIAERPLDDGSLAVAGQLLVTFEWSDWRNALYFWIQSVYVWPEARRSGVYRALYAEVLRLASARGNVTGVKLYVDRDNIRAQETYAALGMSRSHYDLFEVDL